MLTSVHVKMAFASLRSARWRSFLTTLGIVIGIVSVVTTVSIGAGIKRQITSQINLTGANLLTVRAGRTVQRDSKGAISRINLATSFNGPTMSEADYEVIAKSTGHEAVAPLSLVNGIPKVDDHEYDSAFVVATTEQLPQLLNIKVAYGSFFSDNDSVKDGAVIGQQVAERLFHQNIPVGWTFMIRNQTFRVRGILDPVASSPLMPYTDYNNVIFIPSESGKILTGGSFPIYQTIVKTKPNQQQTALDSINSGLLQAHSGQKDFEILKGTEIFAASSQLLKLITTFVTAIASVSLLVGGIGIMNIMLVSVTERTREIGIRKAVGATNRQILMQFLTEATVLSIIGGIIGIALSFILNYFLHVFTSLQPVISWPTIGMATGVAVAVGIFFGVAPAIKASRKDPIEALRYV
ncbi:MAG: ABC transporter permease [Candidatus Saccharimonadales bacterium]